MAMLSTAEPLGNTGPVFRSGSSAKAQGKHVGQPRIPAQKEAAIRRDLLAGRSLLSTIKAHGVGSETVQRIKAEPNEEATAL